jgi:hypothetical protein
MVEELYALKYNAYGYGADLVALRLEDLQRIANEIESIAKRNLEEIERYQNFMLQGYVVAECRKARYFVAKSLQEAKEGCEKFQGGFVRVYSYEDLEKQKIPFKLMLEDAEKIKRAQVGPLNFGVLSRYVITLPTPGEEYPPPKVVTTPEAPPTQVYHPPEVVTIPELPPTPPPPHPHLKYGRRYPKLK